MILVILFWCCLLNLSLCVDLFAYITAMWTFPNNFISENNNVLSHSSFARLNQEKVVGATFEYETLHIKRCVSVFTVNYHKCSCKGLRIWMWTSGGVGEGQKGAFGSSSWEALSCMVALGTFCGGRKQDFRDLGHWGKCPISQISALPPFVGSHRERGCIFAYWLPCIWGKPPGNYRLVTTILLPTMPGKVAEALYEWVMGVGQVWDDILMFPLTNAL